MVVFCALWVFSGPSHQPGVIDLSAELRARWPQTLPREDVASGSGTAHLGVRAGTRPAVEMEGWFFFPINDWEEI